MPTYDYRCDTCENYTEEVRLMAARNESGQCSCGGSTERVILAAPTMTPWDETRKFPNLRKEGDGTMSFPSKSEYESYLKTNEIGEWGVWRAPIRRPHGNRVIGRWDRAGNRLQ